MLDSLHWLDKISLPARVTILILSCLGWLVLVRSLVRAVHYVVKQWRWWCSWFTQRIPLSECPHGGRPKVFKNNDGDWEVACACGGQISSTWRLAWFHWERHVRIVKKRRRRQSTA